MVCKKVLMIYDIRNITYVIMDGEKDLNMEKRKY